jgi:gliding motility-associated-like protein
LVPEQQRTRLWIAPNPNDYMYARIALFALVLWTATSLPAQEIFLTTLDARLYRLDLSDCSYEQLSTVPPGTTDITFHPNGKLYALSSQGRLVELDPNTGMSTFVHQYTQNTFYTALTAAADGRIYATGAPGLLSSFDPATGEEVFYGDIGFDAAGDLSFYNGELYMASYSDDIIRVDIANPANSTVAINGSVSGDIFGIVSYATNCSEVTTYALTNNDTDIYAINFATGTLDLYCSLPLDVGGGASTFEFFGSSPIEITALNYGDFQCASATGFIEIEAAGGVGELSYSLDSLSFQPAGLFTGLAPGNYVAYVRDANGCTAVDTLALDLEQPVTTALTTRPATCGAANGSVEVTLLDPVAPPYTLSLAGQPPTGGTTFSGLAPGDYTLRVSDANGCERVETVRIAAQEPPVIDNAAVVPTRCGAANGQINLAVTGGRPPLAYRLNGGPEQDSTFFFGLSPGTYTVVVRDADQCRDSLQLTVAASNAPRITALRTDTTGCNPAGSGTLQVEAAGGSGNYAYQLSANEPFLSSPVFTDLPPGPYTVRVRDADDCLSAPATVVIRADAQPRLSVSDLSPASCGQADGAFLPSGDGGTGALRLTMAGTPIALAQRQSGLAAGRYALELSDDRGCRDTLTLTVPAGDCPVYLPTAFSPNNDGRNDSFRPYFWPGATGEVVRFSVFDRWGGELFRREGIPLGDPALQWDGRARGQLLQPATYLYLLIWHSPNGRLNREEGEVLLLR